MTTYKIRRFYGPGTNKRAHTVRGMTGLTLQEAQAHCKDPQSSYRTATNAEGKRLTQAFGMWFDGYTEES